MGAQQLKAVDKFRAGDIAANDNDARLTGCALPVVQRHRWVKKMLHAVKHKRHLNADQMYDAFHAQDVGPAQPDERVEPKIKRIRVNRIVQDIDADPIRASCFGSGAVGAADGAKPERLSSGLLGTNAGSGTGGISHANA